MAIEAEALLAILKQHIKVDATGLSPAVASAFVTGFDEAVEAIRSALAEDTARAAEGWEPIETAPKDGNDVLLWVSGIPMVAYWLTHLSKTPGWYISDGHTSHLLAAGTPTHWRLLPLAPALPLDKEAADANR